MNALASNNGSAYGGSAYKVQPVVRKNSFDEANYEGLTESDEDDDNSHDGFESDSVSNDPTMQDLEEENDGVDDIDDDELMMCGDDDYMVKQSLKPPQPPT